MEIETNLQLPKLNLHQDSHYRIKFEKGVNYAFETEDGPFFIEGKDLCLRMKGVDYYFETEDGQNFKLRY